MNTKIVNYVFYTQTNDGVNRKHALAEFVEWVQSEAMLEYFKNGETIYLRKNIKNTCINSVVCDATVDDINNAISY